MKIAAVVILFNPPPTVVANITTYAGFVDKVYIFDNSESGSDISRQLQAVPNAVFFQDQENKGIAVRLNTAADKAISDGYEWLLTMDQDTSFTSEAITNYLNCFNSFSGKDSVAIFGVTFNAKQLKTGAICTAVQADKLITSGSLLNLALFGATGRFDEALFIDAVDYDYCFKAQMKGFSVVRFPNISIIHPIGNTVYASSIKTLFLLKKKKEIHSPLRCYYMYRNMLYLKDIYKNEDPKYYQQIKGYVTGRIKNCILYGRQTIPILRYLRKAKRDYKIGQMGRINHEL